VAAITIFSIKRSNR